MVPYVVLIVALAVTAAAALYVNATASANDRTRFEHLAERTQKSIQRRLDTYINLLRGGTGLFAASDTVKVGDFRAYVERLALAEHYPGVQGIGVSLRFPKQDRDQSLADLRRQPGLADFNLDPNPPRDEHHAIVYLEPMDARNQRAIGFDMFTDPTRRAAMERARDTAAPAMSGRVTLVQEDDDDAPQPGFLIYLPVYYGNPVPLEVDERRHRLAGFVYSPFRAVDLFQGLFGARTPYGIAFEVYDGTDVTPDALLYASDSHEPSASSADDARYTKQTHINIAGRPWTLVFRTRPEFETTSSRGFTLLVIGLGGIVSVVLFTISYGQATARRRAEEAADELRESEHALRASLEQLKAARDNANAARAEAETANRLKDEFLATVSHELRTPLNAILGWAQILREGASDADELAQGLATIERNARAQAQLVEDLLDVSRIVSGKLRLDMQTVELSGVIDAAIEAVRPAADARGVAIHRVLDPATGPVSGDPNRLQQVVWNLLSNAVKFTPRDGSVQVLLQRSAGNAEISVSDTGRGISPEFLPYVFDRFRQADASITRQFGGLGLGLGIVRHLVELHGGTASASSLGEGRGATFAVTLPLAIVPPHTERTVTSPSRAPGDDCAPPMTLSGVRVLVVEDDADSRLLLDKILRDCGASVTTASSAADAFDAFSRDKPDILVSDIGMPDEDGYSLLKRLRATENGNARVPAIALTALARAEDRRRALLAGYQVHLAKPVGPTELRSAIANLIGKHPNAT